MSFIRRRLWILLLLPVLLGANECSESGINADIKDILGLDTDSPAQVAGAIMLGKALGDEDEQNAAELGSTLKDFRRADHEQKGENAYVAKNYVTAADEYRQSLQWLDDTPKNAAKKAELQVGLANSLSSEGDTASDPEQARKAYLQSASLYETLATSGQQPADAMYYDQAASLYHAGGYGAACTALKKSKTVPRSTFATDTFLSDRLRQAGHPCD
jgi:hypothetical protein